MRESLHSVLQENVLALHSPSHRTQQNLAAEEVLASLQKQRKKEIYGFTLDALPHDFLT